MERPLKIGPNGQLLLIYEDPVGDRAAEHLLATPALKTAAPGRINSSATVPSDTEAMDRIWAETKKQMPVHAERKTIIGPVILIAAELDIQPVSE